MLSSLFFSVANGVYQSTVYGMAAKLPFKYTGAIVLGSVSIYKEIYFSNNYYDNLVHQFI